MDRKLLSILIAFVAIVLIFILVSLIGGAVNENLQLNVTGVARIVAMIAGLLIALVIYLLTRQSPIWEVGTREVVYMAIGAALYAIFSYLFNGTVFLVPSVSQVSLRPAIAIPMFFGYAFGPVVGFFTGTVGNLFGDALTGFGLFPQWSVGNGLVGLIAGLTLMFRNRKQSIDTVLAASAVLAILATAMYFFNREIVNEFFFDPYGEPVSLFAGISLIIGLILVLIVRYAFGSNIDVAAAVTWGMLGNIVGIGYAAISDIWVNGYSPQVAIVGEFLPSAGPNLIFAAILVPLLVVAYRAVQRQSGR
jgi:hypothetical protein